MNIRVVLRKACKNGNINKVKEILDKRKQINWNLVKIACNNRHLNIMKYLIDKEKKNNRMLDINIRNKMLVSACHNGFSYIVKYLLDYCEKYNSNMNIPVENMLIAAIHKKSINIVKYIIEYYTQHNCLSNIKKQIFSIACKNEQLHIITYLIEYCENNGERINLNADNYKLLTYCIKRRFTDITRYLIDYLLRFKISINIEYFSKTLIEHIYVSSMIDVLKDIIKYCEIMNNKIKLYTVCPKFINSDDCVKYMFYLYKHNYNLDTEKSYITRHNVLTKENILRSIPFDIYYNISFSDHYSNNRRFNMVYHYNIWEERSYFENYIFNNTLCIYSINMICYMTYINKVNYFIYLSR